MKPFASARLVILLVLGASGLSWGEGSGEPPAAALRIAGIDLIADGPDLVEIGMGVFDPLREGNSLGTSRSSSAGQVEYRLGKKFFFAGPLAGLVANNDGGVFGYGGFYFDLAFRRWTLTPILTLGGYRRGESKVLGGVFEFQTGGTLSRQLIDGSRVGITLRHISNASLHALNPGTELVLVSYLVPLDRLFSASARWVSAALDPTPGRSRDAGPDAE